MGFLPGFREDANGYQLNGDYPNVDPIYGFLDNKYDNPDIDRYLEKFNRFDPSVAVLGDIYSPEQAETYNEVLRELETSCPFKRYIAVPKCRAAPDILSDEFVLGFPNGASDITAEDIGYDVFRGDEVHILGGAPDKQYDAIQKLEQPDLLGSDPADVIGVDWNGFLRPAFAEPGEYWTSDGWQQDRYGASTRSTVEKSLQELKEFWQEKDRWPSVQPCEIYGAAVEEPDDRVYAVSGGDIEGCGELEQSYIINRDGKCFAFESGTAKRFFEYREGLL